MLLVAITSRETIAFALLAIGLVIVIVASGMMAAVGVPMMALGWWTWLESGNRPLTADAAVGKRGRRIAWITISTLLLVAGYIGGMSVSSFAMPSLAVLLVGASVWCLVPYHRELITEGGRHSTWTSLLIAGGLNRWAACTLVVRTIEADVASDGPLARATDRVIECLIVASAAACIVCLTQLWRTRKSRQLHEAIIAVVQMQTAAALAALAAWTWTTAGDGSRGTASLLHVRQWMPFGESLSWAMICWDSLVIAALCTCVCLGLANRRVWASLPAGLLLVDLSALPPLPGFWFKWSTLQSCLYPHHIEPFAGMFDMHEGFRLLSVLALAAQACVSIRLLSWLAEPLFASNTVALTMGDGDPSSAEHASGLA